MSDPAPRVDVLLPVYRARRTVPSALGDVLAQRDVRVRVFAVVDVDDGGRDDGSLAWLEAAARDEPRLVVLRGRGRGAADALDVGLSAGDAARVSHMEADDRCPPDRLARLAAVLAKRPELSGVTSRAGQFGARTAGMRRYLDWQNGLLTSAQMQRERFVEIPALHQTGLYRREALEQVGGYRTRGPWPVDIDFWFRWFEHDLEVVKLPRVLYRWRQHPAQSTRGGGQHDRAALRAAKVDAFARLHGRHGRRPRPVTLVSTGETLRAWRDALTDADVELVADHEWRPGAAAPARRDGSLVLAVYGMPSARSAARDAFSHLAEPEELLFAG